MEKKLGLDNEGKRNTVETETLTTLLGFFNCYLEFLLFCDLHVIHNHFNSMTKSILDANPELFNSQISSVPAYDEPNDVAEEAPEFTRKRRPALGLKHGRFSLKPTRKPSVEDLLPILDLDKLKDPVEFFLAHERLENAKIEIQKQMGYESLESNEDITSTKPRQRRPELPGNNQRPVRYRHRYPRETIVNNDYVPYSQEAIRSDSLDHVGENTDKGGECLASLENEETDLSTIEENKLNDILAGLLRCNTEDLEGDGAMTLLQEGLQIKPIVLEELSVLEFPDNQVTDGKSFRGKLPKPRKGLSNTDNLLKGINNTTPLRQDVGYPVQQLASPTPLRSPFASLSSLQQHISRSKPSVDPFSTHEIDHSSARSCSPTHMINQEPDLVGSEKLSDTLDACIIEDVIAVSKTGSVMDTDINWTGAYGKSKENNYRKSLDKHNVSINENTIELGGTTFVEDTVKNCAGTSQKSVEDNSGEPGFDANIDTNESHVDMDVDIGGSDKDNRVVDGIRPDFNRNGPCEFEGIIHAENMHTPAASVLMDDLNFNLVNPIDKSNPAGCQSIVTYKYTKISDDGPEQCLQVPKEKDDSLVPVNEQRRAKLHSRKQSKHKRISRRQSLGAASTSCNAGLRKSTRIRTRPLEYWKGERMVYGRVHDSLATVIGMKCISPGSDGKPTMKVKSYVSDEYKELFELASLH
ncbi:hypothetical protein Lal_00003903 [Lupinus albus]|nr:hypothetical protein Lal_00003903 [Lupinus albus]